MRSPRRTAAALAVAVVGAASACAVADVAAAAPRPKAAVSCPNADVAPGQASVGSVRAAVLCLMNNERTTRGLGALRAHSGLASVATTYAQQMVQQRFFAHTSPAGSTLGSRVGAIRYGGRLPWSAGENLAWGTGGLATARATVDGWMHSAGHRANVLNRCFTEVGIGIASGVPAPDDGAVPGDTVVADFGVRSKHRCRSRA
jgi:uncharacterized protein YkwD